MRTVAGRLRLDLAQYRELEAFAAFGSDLDKASRAPAGPRAAPGRAAQAAGQYSPFPVEREIVSIWAGTTGKLDDVPVGDVRRFEAEFLDYLAPQRRRASSTTIREHQEARATTRSSSLEQAVEAFNGQFTTSDGESLRSTSPRPRRWTPSERGQERVQVKKKA